MESGSAFSTTTIVVDADDSECADEGDEVDGMPTVEIIGDAASGIRIINRYALQDIEADDVYVNWWEAYDVDYPSPMVGPDGTPVFYDSDIAAIGAIYYLSDPASPIGPRRYIIHPDDVQEGQITEPDEFNFDNLGPMVTLNTVAFNRLWDEQWINADFDLIKGVSASSSSDDVIVLADYGVGKDDASRKALRAADSVRMTTPVVWYDYRCGADAITNADLAVTVTDSLFDGHRICAYGEDLLDNPGVIQHSNLRSYYKWSNWFGKDIVPPTLDMAMSTRGGFAAFTTPPITANDSVGLNNALNLFNILKPYDDLGANPRGWGIDAYDNAAGFHQNYTGTGVGPAVQKMYRYYPNAATTATVKDSTVMSTWLGVQLAVPGETWNRSSNVGFGVGGAVEALADPTTLGTRFGLYVWDVKVTDMAGNASTLKRNFAVDQNDPTGRPTLAQITLGQLQYNPGQFGLFNIWGSDDFEVDTIQVAMDYPAVGGGAFRFWYPPTKADPTISPWDMDYRFDVVGPFAYSAGINTANPVGILGRMDMTLANGTLDPVAANYNVDGPDVDLTAGNDDMLPTQVWGNILTDILGNTTVQAPIGPTAIVGFDFGGWGSTTAQPWTAALPDFIHFRLIDKMGVPPGWGVAFTGDFAQLRAEHKVTNSIIAPWFNRVFLVHNDGATPAVIRVCGEMSVVVQTDEGVDRFFRYNLPTGTTVPAYCSAAGTLHAVGTKGSAALVSLASLNIGS